jgi:hypothetical protein
LYRVVSLRFTSLVLLDSDWTTWDYIFVYCIRIHTLLLLLLCTVLQLETKEKEEKKKPDSVDQLHGEGGGGGGGGEGGRGGADKEVATKEFSVSGKNAEAHGWEVSKGKRRRRPLEYACSYLSHQSSLLVAILFFLIHLLETKSGGLFRIQ